MKRKLASLSEATQFGLLLRGKRRPGKLRFQGVAQLVARSVRDAEVVGSSPITLTREETSGMRLVFLLWVLVFKAGADRGIKVENSSPMKSELLWEKEWRFMQVSPLLLV